MPNYAPQMALPYFHAQAGFFRATGQGAQSPTWLKSGLSGPSSPMQRQKFLCCPLLHILEGRELTVSTVG